MASPAPRPRPPGARPPNQRPPNQRTPDPRAPQLVRRAGGRVIGGVAGGVADHLGVDATKVRVTFAALTLFAGAGAIAYAVLWFLCPIGNDVEKPSAAERRRAVGLAVAAVLGALLLAALSSSSVRSIVVPLLVVAVGAALVWREADSTSGELSQRLRDRSGSRARTLLRIIGGVTLVVAGLALVLLARVNVSALGTSVLAVAVTLLGVVLLTVPLWLRMWRDLEEERAALVRTTERDEIASHLHDSVLQTLALIQRQSDNPTVRRLARSQERQLRQWLFGGPETAETSFAAALTVIAADVEDTHGVAVQPVTVGDLAVDELLSAPDDRYTALVQATREALVNAAKHSGEDSVDLYAEVQADTVAAYVRDRGVGFDPDAVKGDRQGLAKSVRGRLERRGGSVTVKSAVGRGTEVKMSVPRATPRAADDPIGA